MEFSHSFVRAYNPVMSTFTTTHRFTTAEYGQMIRAGVLTRDDRVELLDGEIIDMAPIGPEHNSEVDFLSAYCNELSAQEAIVRTQGSIQLDDLSQPQPDIALLRPRKDFYRHKLPGPKDVFLIIEVADSSLLLDRDRKVPLYAKAGIAEMWLVDLVSHEVVVHRQPRGGKYVKVTRHRAGDRIAPLAFPKHFLKIAGMFG